MIQKYIVWKYKTVSKRMFSFFSIRALINLHYQTCFDLFELTLMEIINETDKSRTNAGHRRITNLLFFELENKHT